jgi:AcrR family transcriptional regulator
MHVTLVRAGLTVLQRDGAGALTVRNIAAEAGCSTTGIYTYFGGKHGLVEAIFVEGFESFDAATEPFKATLDLAGGCRAYREWALANPTQYMVMFGRAVPDFVPSGAALSRALQSFLGLADVIQRIAPGDDYLERAYRVFATQHGCVMIELSDMVPPVGASAGELYERAIDAMIGQW